MEIAPVQPRTSAPRWSGGAWVLLCLSVAVYATVLTVVTLVVIWGASTTCEQTPTTQEVWQGQRALLVLLLLAATPWALLASLSKNPVRIVVAGLVASAPALFALVIGLDADTWRGSFCF